ncbi:MAG TPA: ATP synthase F1 subunit delta [Arachidicoccus sp.]
MQNPRLSAIYAKSLADVAVERNQFDQAYNDMQYIKSICKVSQDFVVLLKSPVVFADKKQAIFSQITKGNISELTASFVALLIKKGREGFLPEIADAFIREYNKRNGINIVKMTTAAPLSEQNKNSILEKLKTGAGFDKVELETAVKEDLIGGFVLEYNNNLVDASIARELRDIKKKFQQNFVY